MSEIPTAGIEGLPDSLPLLDNFAALHERWDADGVLYFRNAVGQAAIASTRAAYMERLKELGAVAPGAEAPVWTGLNRLNGRLARRIGDEVWRSLVADPSLDSLVCRFLGETPSWVPIVVHRSAPPAADKNVTDAFQARHQDGVFNHGIDFITCWIPLMDIDAEVGGLAVVPGSHKKSFYDFKDNKSPGRPQAIPYGVIPAQDWRRPDYKAGDLLMFHSMTAHAGLPNLSDRFRLSVDIRFLPGSAPKPIIGIVTGLEGAIVNITAESGEHMFGIDDETMVRGPKANRVYGDELASVLFPGANIIAVPDRAGHAQLVRSVSRKHLDLPAGWFTELPTG